MSRNPSHQSRSDSSSSPKSLIHLA